MKTMFKPNTLYLRDDGPFYRLVIIYQTLFLGLIPVFKKEHRLDIDSDAIISFGSKTSDIIYQHINEIVNTVQKNEETLDTFGNTICCMFSNHAYEIVKDFNNKSLEFEFFRHVRNAASHNNKFNFNKEEPRRPASWRGILIDSDKKGPENKLHGMNCFGEVLGSADLFYLLSDIERQLPTECFLSTQTDY